ncbi:sulfite exporter TauE/SafE family protein [Dehalococcoidia bacterium]|nr:sulfite exporter TauE/SafE family protein [Dehalococcoidia bacterium]
MDITQTLSFVTIGLVAGAWGTLIGAGGGFLMVPLLLFFEGTLSVPEVTAVSLIAVCANAVSGTRVYAKLGRIDYRSGLLFLAATIPGSIIGALAVNNIREEFFQGIFGFLLILVSLYTLASQVSRAGVRGNLRGSYRKLVDYRGEIHEYRILLKAGSGIAFIVGFVASGLGVGGGIFTVPAFVFLLGVPIQIATATSQFMVIGTSLMANITNAVEGDLWGLWPVALSLSVGAIIGGQIGGRISQRLSSRWISRVLSMGLLVAGIRLFHTGITSI